MNSRSLSTIAVIGFLLLGGISWGLRYQALREERIAREDSLWELTYSVQFQALITENEEAIVNLAMPFDTSHCRVVDRTWIIRDPNLRASERGPYALTGNQFLELKTRIDKPAPYDVVARFMLRLSPRVIGRRSTLETLPADAELRFLRAELGIPVQSPIVREKAQLVPDEAQTEAERLQWIFDYCSDIDSGAGPEAAGDDVESALSTLRGSPKARARSMVALCRAVGFYSRIVTGFKIQQGTNVLPHLWVEVFQDQEWVPFDPSDGWSQTLPMNYVPVRRGGGKDGDEVYYADNADGISAVFSIKRLGPDSLVLQAGTPYLTQVFDLTRLPVSMHRVMQLLLLLPFAALITAVMRNVVGMQTFGTFAPALLAMSFIYANWETGLAILLIVAVMGLTGRLFLEKLRLLMVPRLSIILTLVILCVVFSVSSLDFLGVTPSADAVLLPMVILATLIERVHVTMEEDGLMYTLKLCLGTIFVAALCYLVLNWDEVGEWVLTFPEIHFFTIAAFILLGRYAGYRLTELWRFRDLVEPSEPAR